MDKTLILIAESKTMAPCSAAVDPTVWATHRPLLGGDADRLAEGLRKLSATQLADAVKLSPTMAARFYRMLYDFPDKSSGEEAIKAFTGVVFRAFGYDSLLPAEKARTARSVRIVSSLYGLLRPTDIIKPYRLDFTTRLAPGHAAMATWWRPAVTDALIAEIEAGEIGCIVNLLPADASRSIDWKRIEPMARVTVPDLREAAPDGSLRNPPANRLKMLRGMLLRELIEGETSPSEIVALGD